MTFSYNRSYIEGDPEKRLNNLGQKSTWPIFPFEANADTLYNFVENGTVSLDGRNVIEIQVIPGNRDIPLVSGVFKVDDFEKVVTEAEFTFNEAAKVKDADIAEMKNENPVMGSLISIDENYFVETKKGLFYSLYWLPVKRNEEIFMKVLGFSGKNRREIEFFNYVINPESDVFPDSLNTKVVFDIDFAMQKSKYKKSGILSKVDPEEENEVRENVHGFFRNLEMNDELFDYERLGKRFVDLQIGRVRGIKFLSGIQNHFAYNRVEGAVLKGGLNGDNMILNNTGFGINGAFGFADQQFKGEIRLLKFFGKNRKVFVESNLYKRIDYNEKSDVITSGKNSLSSLFAGEDYRDYFYSEGGSIGIGYKPFDIVAVRLKYISQNEKQAQKNTDFSLTKWNNSFRIDPVINQYRHKGLNLYAAAYWANGKMTIGIDHSDKEFFHTQFDHTLIYGSINLTYSLAPGLEIKVNTSSGTGKGNIPSQKLFRFGGKTLFNTSGKLRGVGLKSITGNRYLSTTIEFPLTFDSVFNMTESSSGWDNFERLIKINPWIGYGWSHLDGKYKQSGFITINNSRDMHGGYWEAGVGIADRFSFFRIDVYANNLDDRGVSLSFNVYK